MHELLNDFFLTLYNSPHWVFIIFGCILLIAELLGTGGYSLCWGTSAIIVGLIARLLPLPWTTLWILFAVFTVASTYIWWIWLKKHSKDDNPQHSELNQPQKELIGIKTVVVEPIIHGSGRVKIKDGTWSARCDENLTAGTVVQVIAVDGVILTVARV